MTTSTDIRRIVRCPDCDVAVPLAASERVHSGYPRRRDAMFLQWTYKCDGCGKWWGVSIEQRLRREYVVGKWETLRRLVGAPIFFDAIAARSSR